VEEVIKIAAGIGVSRRRHGACGAPGTPDPDVVGRSRHDRVGPSPIRFSVDPSSADGPSVGKSTFPLRAR
jgi:hypothetical protein